MIGVISNPPVYGAVCEFFELFKTPWEFFRCNGRYDVLICAGDAGVPENSARLVLIYSGRLVAFDTETTDFLSEKSKTRVLLYDGTRMPVYGDSMTFRGGGGGGAVLVDEESKESAICFRRSSERTLIRIGYSLFEEFRTLLTVGQPVANAATPTLDLHIGLLRDLIAAAGIPLAEIPPVPDGYRFVACLTHDIDHPFLRRHKFDHTTAGFLYRAVVGSAIRVLRRRLPLRGLLRNWLAAMKLPLVHLGLARDFWREFDRYYGQLEQGAPSTFFVIPFKDRAGRNAPRFRASPYGAAEISDKMRALMSTGCEIGLHGIDAWCDSSTGRAELEEIRAITGQREIGARMHWLYYDEESPLTLEQAGIDYDSTIGYNETIGYRAGTTQVYKPLQTSRLLELPLHVMDTALFYPCHLNLSPHEAEERIGRIIANAVKLGGCITVNWHDRSIAPERLWDDFYSELANEIKTRGGWIATAEQAVAWFRKRRSAKFETDGEFGGVNVRLAAGVSDHLPRLQLRIHNEAGPHQSVAVCAAV